MFVCVQFMYLQSSWAQQTPPLLIQAKNKGIGQTMERCWQDVQKGERERRFFRVEGIMESGGGGQDKTQGNAEL